MKQQFMDYEIVLPHGEKPFVVVFEREHEDRGIAGEGQRVDTAMRNAARNLKQISDKLWADSFKYNTLIGESHEVSGSE